MSFVKYANLCDICTRRGPEWHPGYVCKDCGKRINKCCSAPGSEDDETTSALCIYCAVDIHGETAKELQQIALDRLVDSLRNEQPRSPWSKP